MKSSIHPNDIDKSRTNEYAEGEVSKKSLTLMKKAWRQVEDDSKLLENGIALSKQEEIKTEETSKKNKWKKMKNEEKHKQVFHRLSFIHYIFF